MSNKVAYATGGSSQSAVHLALTGAMGAIH